MQGAMLRPTLLLLAISFTSAQEASSGVASAGGQQCPTSHPNKCLSESDVNKPIHYESDVNEQIHPKYFHGPCCDKDPDCICNAQHLGEHCGEGCDDGAHALPHEPVPVGESDAQEKPHRCSHRSPYSRLAPGKQLKEVSHERVRSSSW